VVAILVASVGASVVLGWLFDVALLKTVLPGLVSMRVNTALAFIAAGLSLRFVHSTSRPLHRCSLVLGGMVTAIGGLTLTEDLAGIDLGIDQLVLRGAQGAAIIAHPGRMSLLTSFSFFLVGIGLLALAAPLAGRSAARVHRGVFAPLLVSALAIVGYSYSVRSLYKIGPYSEMALHTAVCFFLLSLAMLAANSAHGIGRILASEAAGGVLARRLLPIIPVVLFAVGWLRLAGQDAGLYDTRFGLALMVVCSIALTVLAVTSTAVKLNAVDVERGHAQDAVVHASVNLERRVQERTRELEDSLEQIRVLDAARAEAELTLANERALLETVVHGMGAGLITADARGNFVLFNPAAERLMGAGKLASSPERWAADYNVYRPDTTTPFPSTELPLPRALRGESSDAVEIYVSRPEDGVWLSVNSRPLRDATGALVGGVAVFTDVTERHQDAAQIAAVNGRLEGTVAALERLNSEKTALAELGDALLSCSTLDEAYDEVALAATRIFPLNRGELMAVNPSQNRLVRMAQWGDGWSSDERLFVPDDCLAVRRGKVHLTTDSERGRCAHLPRPNADGHVCMPLMGQDGIIGVLHLELAGSAGDAGGAAIQPDQVIRTAAAAASLVAAALTSIRLKEKLRYQSLTDALTGLFNRRYMEESLKREIARAERHGGTVGVIMLDVDHFKRLNDEYGHAAGDSVLKELGALLGSRVRSSDIACRYGGEEFALILPDTSLEETYSCAEAIRTAVAGSTTEMPNGAVVRVTVSQGVAAFRQNGAMPAELLHAADVALYEAKQNGRNRVEKAAPRATGDQGRDPKAALA